MHYRSEDIARIISAERIGSSSNRPIRYLATDSRRLHVPAASLFFALKGSRQDGHAFLRNAYDKGVRAFVVATMPEEELPNAVYFVVEDPLRALQDLAIHHRAQFSYPVLGLTGSNGKTWVKEWLFQLLRGKYQIVRSPASYNSQIGVPLSVCQMDAEHELALIEAGISRPGEMAILSGVIRPDIGIFTNLGDAHSEGFSDQTEKLREKLLLFESVQTIIYCRDDTLVHKTISTIYPDKRLVSWSIDEGGDLLASVEQTENHKTKITITYGQKSGSYELPYGDHPSVQNSILCTLACLDLGLQLDVLLPLLEQLRPLSMRLEIKEIGDNCLMINDSYSFDMQSLHAALDVQNQYVHGRKKSVILSDLPHFNPGRYRQLAAALSSYGVSKVLFTGEHGAMLRDLLPSTTDFQIYETTGTLQKALAGSPFKNEVILVKGARVFEFEKIAGTLRNLVHSAVLEIDLAAMLHNLQFFGRQLNPGTRVLAMVKASAYGSGSSEIAKFLAFHNVDMFAVAYIDEGVLLRKDGIAQRIMVLNPDIHEFETLFRYDLEPEVYNLSQLDELGRLCAQHDASIITHLKLESGMHRLGFESEDLPALISWITAQEKVTVGSVFTHLSSSEDPAEDAFTHLQIKRFNALYSRICAGIRYRPERHLLNSSGIVRFPEYQYEMIRLGIGLYGVGMHVYNDKLLPVHSLRAKISQISDVHPGETIGYGRKYQVRSAMRVGTVNIGYADGLMRLAGNERFAVSVQGGDAKILGNVCMDMCMIDLTALPGVQEGDDVYLFSQTKRIEELAEACQTIPYEILTRISPRVARVFHYA